MKRELLLQQIRDNQGIIFKVCNSYCSNPHERDDLAQEIIYQLLRSGEKYDSSFRFTTWMYRVALNVAISFYRKNRNNREQSSLTESHEQIRDDAANPELENNILLLQRFISELKELDKALMILYLESRSYSEIADILGISETNVGTRLSRIKEKLKQQFSSIA
jgi:RNA polymerase sigma-70 factor (ECF subfamily)